MENSRTLWHNLVPGVALNKAFSRIDGLAGEEVEERLARYGVNELTGKKKDPYTGSSSGSSSAL